MRHAQSPDSKTPACPYGLVRQAPTGVGPRCWRNRDRPPPLLARVRHATDDRPTPDESFLLADAYREFLAVNGLDVKINAELDKLNVDDTQALAICGKQVREWIMAASFPDALNKAIAEHYEILIAKSGNGATFAVRS